MSESGALQEISATIANNATWQEDYWFTEAGVPMDLTGLDFKYTFRKCATSSSADLTLSTDDGTLSIVEDTASGINRILRINVPPAVLSGMSGDYIADLASRDVNSAVHLWGHGVVTFTPNPVSF